MNHPGTSPKLISVQELIKARAELMYAEKQKNNNVNNTDNGLMIAGG